MKRKTHINLLLLMILSLGFATTARFAIKSVSAQTIQLKLEPDFYFASEVGEEFDINVTINNVNASLHLVAIHFRLYYDPELLSVVNVSEGDFLPNFDQGFGTLFIWATEPDGIFGPHVVVGNMLLPNSTGQWPGPFPEGSGVVATIRFRVEYRPVEPEPIAICVLRFLEVKLADDQGNEITDYATGISLYQSPVPMRYPVASFTFTPSSPMVGQTVLFNASESYDPDGNITEYTWDFGDGTTLTTNETAVTHIFTRPKTYNVTLYVTDNHGLQSNITVPVEVGFYTPVEIKIESGELYYPGETAEFYISTSQLGKAVNVAFTELSLYFDGSQFADLSGLIQSITDGLYLVKYTIPQDAQPGVYLLYVKVEFSNLTGIAISSFQVSGLFSDINAVLVALNGTVAYVNSTLGMMQVSLSDINAMLVALNGTSAYVNSTLGTIQVSISDINLRVTEISGDIATLDSTLGSIQGTVESIEGDVATIKTDIGTLKVDISGIKDATADIVHTEDLGGISTLLYVTLAFALISAIAAILGILILRKS